MARCAVLGALALATAAPSRWIKSSVIQWRVPDELVTVADAGNSSIGSGYATQLAVSADGKWFATGSHKEVFTWRMPDCVVTAQSASCPAQTTFLQRFTLSSPLSTLGVLDDMHIAIATKEQVTFWQYDSGRSVATLDYPGVISMQFEDDYVLLGCDGPGGAFHMGRAIYREDLPDSRRYFDTEGVPRIIWSFSLANALSSDVIAGNYEITTVALCKGDFWFAIGAFDPVALTSMTLLWKLNWEISPANVTSHGSLTRFFSDISPVLAMRFSPRKDQLIQGSESGVISFWEHLLTKQSEPIGELVLPWPVRFLELSPDGNWLVASDQRGNARLYPNPAEYTQNIQEAASFQAPGPVALSADQGWLLLGTSATRIQAWPLDLRKPQASFTFAANGQHQANFGVMLLLSPQEDYILTGAPLLDHTLPSVSLWAASRELGPWWPQGPLLSLPLNGTFCCMQEVSQHQDHWQILIASQRRYGGLQGGHRTEMFLWNVTWPSLALALPTAKLEASYSLPNCKAMSLAFIAPSLVIVGCSSKVLVLQMDSESAVTTLLSVQLPPMVAATAMVALQDNMFVFGSSRGDVCLGTTAAIQMDASRCFYPGGRINALHLSDDGKELYTGSSSGRICRLQLEPMQTKNISCFTQPGLWPDNEVLSLALLRHGRDELVSSSANGMLATWDLREMGALGETHPLEIMQTDNYQARVVVGENLTYYYVSGTLGVIEAYFVNSMAASVQRMEQSKLCTEMGAHCSCSWVRSHSQLGISIPSYVDNLPIEWLSLQRARVESMGERPPISMRKVNLSGVVMSDWRLMGKSWWSVPSKIDVTNTTYVQIPILHGEALRLVTDANCIRAAQQKEPNQKMNFCVRRAPQLEGELCAKHFVSCDMKPDALAASITGSPLPILTQIFVDLSDFYPWLCDCPAGTFGPNGSHCEVCPMNHYCPSAGNLSVAMNQDPKPCPPNSGTTREGLSKVNDCECLPGFYSNTSDPATAPYHCQRCPESFTSDYGSWQCHSCFFGFRPVHTGDTVGRHGDCMPDWFGVGYFVVLQIAMIQLAMLYWLFMAGLPINDVSKQNGQWVVSTCGLQVLWMLPWLKKAYAVSFRKTGNPGLDQHIWELQALRGIGQRFVLLAMLEDHAVCGAQRRWNMKLSSTIMAENSQRSLQSALDLPMGLADLDTSQGFLHFRSPWVLLFFERIPLGLKLLVFFSLPWPLWMRAFHQRDWLVLGLALSFAIAVILLVLVSLFMAPAPTIEANLSNFRHFLSPQPREDVLERSVDVADMSNLLVHFKFFIGGRNAHYVNSNILLPITSSHCLSFAEMLQPRRTPPGQYFVSHWWGAPFDKSMQSICKHAQLAESNWKEARYWCCLFSMNQWSLEEELGGGDLARSSFLLVLTDPSTHATLLLLDDEVGCLSRSWCLFEVLQTCLRSTPSEGLLLCTPFGVMNKAAAHASIDTAIVTAQRLVHLRFEDAQATNPADKEIIDLLVGRYPGKQPAMNALVQHHIREALSYIKDKHNQTFAKLMTELASSPRAAPNRPTLVHQPSLQWNSALEIENPSSPHITATGEARWFSWLNDWASSRMSWASCGEEDSDESGSSE